MVKLRNHEVGIRAVNFVIIGEYIYETLGKFMNETIENGTGIQSLDK